MVLWRGSSLAASLTLSYIRAYATLYYDQHPATIESRGEYRNQVHGQSKPAFRSVTLLGFPSARAFLCFCFRAALSLRLLLVVVDLCFSVSTMFMLIP